MISYNSIQEIFDADVANMECIRNNQYDDSSTFSIAGVDWFTFNGNTASTVYVSSDSWLGFGANTSHLCINNRDTSSHYIYREEGLLYDYYRFLRIRWIGASRYNRFYDPYILGYDVVLWDTGTISLYMFNIPGNYYDGTFKLVASATISYTKPSASSQHITFIPTDETNAVYNAQYSMLELDPPFDKRLLIESDGKFYTEVTVPSEDPEVEFESQLLELEATELTPEIFREYGVDAQYYTLTPELVATLHNPTIYYWVDTLDYAPRIATSVIAVPHPQTLYSPNYDMTDETILGIEKSLIDASEDCLFAISFDEGTTWKMHTGEVWGILSEEDTGMSVTVMNAITAEQWAEVATTGMFKLRVTLPTETSYVGSVIIDYINPEEE